MGTLIHSVGHGLVADDTIMLGNLVGGEGLSENTLYYVLAAGLTADDFAVSETSGGSAVAYTTDITDGVVVRSDTYSVVSDGVMDPPTTPTTPTGPSVASIEVSGVTRLSILLDVYTDTAVRVRSHELQVTHRYDGSNPDWAYAQVLTLPLGTTDITVPCIPSTAYAVRVRVQDVFGNFSAWGTPVELTTGAGADSVLASISELANDIPDGTVTSDKIVSNAIIGRHILAGEVTADKLATTLLLASLIQTAETGRRIEIDVDGIRLYDTDESLLVRIPTNGDPVYVRGEVNASTLVAEDSTTLNGTAALSGSSIMTLKNGISAPTAAPSVSNSVDYLTITAPTGSIAASAGIAYDSGAGTYWVACDPTVSPYYVAQEFNATTGALVSTISATGSITTYTTTAGSTSHVSDTAQAYSGSTNSHIATNITMPSGRSNMQITKVSVYLAGYGGSATCYNVLWNDVSGTGNYVARSASYTAASATFANGNSAKYDKSLTSPYSVSAGTIYAGVYHSSSGDGIQYDRDDGSGKNTYGGDGSGTATADFDGTGWGALTTSSKPNVYVTYTYDVDTRLETAPMIGIATDGTYVYTLDTAGTIWKYDSTGAYVTSASLAASISGTASKAGLFYDATAGTLIITTTTGTGAGVYPKFVAVNTSLAATGTAYSAAAGTTFSGTTDTFRGGARLADPLNASAATYWVATTSAVYAYTFSGSTATQTSNRDFGSAPTTGDGLTHDGTVFRGWDSASNTKVWKFSSWDWTTGGTTWWFGYAWYANTGGYVTEVGPTTSVTANRRTRVQVQNASLPGGSADRVRIYSYQGASDAAAGSRWLQVTDALTSRYITDYANATHDSTTNTFSAGTPAELKSEATGWSLKGDGSVSIASTTPIGGKPPVVNVYAGSGTSAVTSSTWTKPSGLVGIMVECVGGGGGGGGVTASATAGHFSCGSGGGGGGYVRKWYPVASLSAASYTVRAANGGLGGTSAAGATGGTSDFGITGNVPTGGGVSATGGGGGARGADRTADTAEGAGAAGGTGSGGDVNATGGGAQGSVIIGGVPLSGKAGDSIWGGGDSGTRISSGGTGSAGGNGTGYGGGGSGAGTRQVSTSYAGGNGAVGVVVITEYYGA